jgi:hypothetical protein
MIQYLFLNNFGEKVLKNVIDNLLTNAPEKPHPENLRILYSLLEKCGQKFKKARSKSWNFHWRILKHGR